VTLKTRYAARCDGRLLPQRQRTVEGCRVGGAG
jgi:hypothetical protein